MPCPITPRRKQGVNLDEIIKGGGGVRGGSLYMKRDCRSKDHCSPFHDPLSVGPTGPSFSYIHPVERASSASLLVKGTKEWLGREPKHTIPIHTGQEI